MKTIALSLLFAVCLLTGRSGMAQNMNNTSTTITIDHSCMNQAFIGGSYSMVLAYNDPDNGYTTLPSTSVTVVSNGVDNLTITAAGITVPSPATNGYWALKDATNGMITLTGGWSPIQVFWYHDEAEILRFNCVPLPIYFSSFTSSVSSGVSHLSWVTQTEQNTTFIEVYRSTTGSSTSYVKIGQVAAAGNSTGTHNYTYNDNAPAASNFYQLKMLNSQGTQSIYSIIVHNTCATCHWTPPAAVNCPYTINGPTTMCNIETRTGYTLSSPVPNFSTITWSVNQPTVAAVLTNASFSREHVTLLKKNSSGTVILSASMSGCSNVITKTINIGLAGDCGGAFAAAKSSVAIKLSPNPSTGVVSLSLAPQLNTESTLNSSVTPAAIKPMIYQVKVADASGTVRKVFSYPGGVENVTVNLNGLNGGIYTVQVFDNKSWTSTQMVLAK